MKRFSLKKQNKGASLLAVLVALVFVGAIAIIITSITMVNIRMREVEQAGKKNFYSAEEYMDVVRSAVNTVAADAMEDAHEDVYARYDALKKSGYTKDDVEKEFKKVYMKKLCEKFVVSTASASIKYESDGVTPVYMSNGLYSTVDLVTNINNLESNAGAHFVTDAADASCDVDYQDGLFTLKNIKVTYTNAQNYETVLTTDIVLHTPDLDINKSDKVPDITKYSLIADTQIHVDASSVNVGGNVYAGHDGILYSGSGSGTFSGDTIITRGDIITDQGTTATIGAGAGSKIWAENLRTTGEGSPSNMTVNGNMFIANDLILEGKDSNVTLQGKYYGYNFQDKYTGYDGSDSTKPKDIRDDAAYNSAILINAQSGKVDMTGLDYLMLAGRAFISRGELNSTDVKLGEGISPRTSQLAILVPSNCLDDETAANPHFTTDGLNRFQDSIHVTNVLDYVDAVRPVTAYYYVEGGADQHRYYLNFKDDQKANDFYKEYFDKNTGLYNARSDSYLDTDALIINSSMVYTLRGNLLYRNAANANLTEQKITINNEDWEKNAVNGFYWDFADSLAKKYKSLETKLDPSGNGIDSEEVRFPKKADGSIDKTVDGLFDKLIEKDELISQIKNPSADSVKEEMLVAPSETEGGICFANNSGGAALQIGDSAGQKTVKNGTSAVMDKGLVIATGDVQVKGNFKGTIISGNKITFTGGAQVSADSVMLTKLIQDHADILSKILKNYNVVAGSTTDLGTIDQYTAYDNWKKNED